MVITMRAIVLVAMALTIAALPVYGGNEVSVLQGQVWVYAVGSGYMLSAKVQKNPAEWRELMTADQFRVLRKQGTERAFTGAYWDNHEPGIYRCAGCGLDLFRSSEKYDSGTGWPSFYAPVAPENVIFVEDGGFIEVRCARCDGHLGHVFSDGPLPSGKRYCMNSAALLFIHR